MLNIKITGSGCYIPPKVETADQIASKIGKTKEMFFNAFPAS